MRRSSQTGGAGDWLRGILRRLLCRDGGARNQRSALPALASPPEVRARQLLRRTLNPAQRRDFEEHGCFSVESPGRGTYIIFPRATFNVMDARTGAHYCCVTETPVPLFDLMLVQKLLLEHDPDRFFAAANCRAEVKRRGDEPRIERVLGRT